MIHIRILNQNESFKFYTKQTFIKTFYRFIFEEKKFELLVNEPVQVKRLKKESFLIYSDKKGC